MDRQPDPRHTRRRREDRLPGRCGQHEPPASVGVPAGDRAYQGRVLQDAGPQRCRGQMMRFLKEYPHFTA